MRAIGIHPDVIVFTSLAWQTNAIAVRSHDARVAAGRAPAGSTVTAGGAVSATPAGGAGATSASAGAGAGADRPSGAGPGAGADPAAGSEAFLIDSPLFPDELEMLPQVLEQAGFRVVGLLATHGDWDHLLGRLAFPQAPLGCAETTAARLTGHPGEAQRELRAWDDEHYVERPAPLSLPGAHALPVPGFCEVGDRELELHPADGHTEDGCAVWIPWAQVLACGDYLSPVEIPIIAEGGSLDGYLATLERLRPLVEQAETIVPGHGPTLDATRALAILREDVAYLQALRTAGRDAQLPLARRTPAQRRIHAENAAQLGV